MVTSLMGMSVRRSEEGSHRNAATFLPKRTMSNKLRELIARHCRRPETPTAIPRLTLSRPAATAALAPGVVTPLLCVLAPARKRLELVRDEYRGQADNRLV